MLSRKIVSTDFQLNGNYMSRSFLNKCIENLIDGECYMGSAELQKSLVDDHQRTTGRDVRIERKNSCYLVINDRPFVVKITEPDSHMSVTDVETGGCVAVVDGNAGEDVHIHNVTAVMGRSHTFVESNKYFRNYYISLLAEVTSWDRKWLLATLAIRQYRPYTPTIVFGNTCQK